MKENLYTNTQAEAVLNTIFARSSIRAYTDEPLTPEEISTLADAALAAPTAMNRQAQRFFFITDKELINKWEIAVCEVIEKNGPDAMRERMKERSGKVFYNAPLFVAIAVDKSGKYSMCDSGIAVGTLALAAKAMGLDSVILGMPDLAFSGECAGYLRERLGLAENLEFAVGIAIGHAAMDKAPHETDNSHVIYI
ncbi:MAG: nitroreductase family protein [Clostridia bacterium]|nr:nitroreductase family protein [Clostridia bacterium]